MGQDDWRKGPVGVLFPSVSMVQRDPSTQNFWTSKNTRSKELGCWQWPAEVELVVEVVVEGAAPFL